MGREGWLDSSGLRQAAIDQDFAASPEPLSEHMAEVARILTLGKGWRVRGIDHARIRHALKMNFSTSEAFRLRDVHWKRTVPSYIFKWSDQSETAKVNLDSDDHAWSEAVSSIGRAVLDIDGRMRPATRLTLEVFDPNGKRVACLSVDASDETSSN